MMASKFQFSPEFKASSRMHLERIYAMDDELLPSSTANTTPAHFPTESLRRDPTKTSDYYHNADNDPHYC